jgi:hypothetical protein
MATSSHRILAVEFRAGRLGYAVLESPLRLNDFGAACVLSLASARSRIARLLRIWRPTILVLRGTSFRYRFISRQRRPVVRVALDEARKAGIPVARFTEEGFNAFFERHSCSDKYEMAEYIAASIPEMAWRLPPRPKMYDPEPRTILYFDSISLAFAYLELGGEKG